MAESYTIRVDQYLPYTQGEVWKALTDPTLIAKWLVPNDFQLAIGHHFTFNTVPIPPVQFGGIVYCEVLEFEVERSLRYSWVDRGEENGLNSFVTWRLVPEDDGTHLYMEQEGFDPNHPLQVKGYQMMSQGWSRIVGYRIAEVLAGD